MLLPTNGSEFELIKKENTHASTHILTPKKSLADTHTQREKLFTLLTVVHCVSSFIHECLAVTFDH